MRTTVRKRITARKARSVLHRIQMFEMEIDAEMGYGTVLAAKAWIERFEEDERRRNARGARKAEAEKRKAMAADRAEQARRARASEKARREWLRKERSVLESIYDRLHPE